MHIDFQRLDHLNARMTLVINREDYTPVLEENLKKYAKKLSIKGFRAGKSQRSVMNKMYGKGILEETVTKLLNEKLFGYLDEQKIAFFGSPMMAEDATPVEFNPKEPSDYTFTFDLGLKPSFDLNYQEGAPLDIVIPALDQQALDQDILRYRRIFGTDEIITEGGVQAADKVGLLLRKVNDDGSVAEESKETTLDLDRVQGEANEKLLHLKVGDSLRAELDTFTGYSRSVVIRNTLGLEADPDPDKPLFYQVEVTSIHRPQVTPLTGEQLTKFVGRSMEGEADFRKMLEEREEQQINTRALDMKKLVIRRLLLDANAFEVPDTFLLRWLNHQRDKQVEAGSLEARHFIRDARWSLLLNKIADDKKVEVTEKDVQRQVTNWIVENVNYTQTDIRKLMNQLYANDYFMSSMKENALEDVVFREILPMYRFVEKSIDQQSFEKEFHDIHHVVFDHGDHDHDHGHHHPHHEHSHGSHEHSHG